MRTKLCSCGGTMRNIGQTRLQEGKYSLLLGHLSNLFSGALCVDIDCCERCRRLEFYLAEDVPAEVGSGITQIVCDGCGELHDADDAICPHCGRRLMW